MSGVRDLSRRKWTVLTAIFAAIAVITAMVTVPWNQANAEESNPTDFEPNVSLGDVNKIMPKGVDTSWGPLVWAGTPPEGAGKGNPNNNVGWGWCIEPFAQIPLQTNRVYAKENAERLEISPEYRDGVINLGRKLKDAAKRKDSKAAANYSVYLAALIAEKDTSRAIAAATITGRDPSYGALDPGQPTYPSFTGSHEEFTELTGYRIADDFDPPKFEKDPSVQIPEQPEDAYITIVRPHDDKGRVDKTRRDQPVMPPDQPGLPDTEEDEPEESTTPEQPSEEETTEDEPTEEESTPNSTEEQPSDEETSTEETTSSEEPSTEQTTTQPSTEPSESTPTTSASEKKLQPKIGTKAEFADDADQVVAGAKVKDTVHYEDLVPHKKYTLEAELKDKAGDHEVVGKGKKTFTPEKSSGDVDVEITVDSDLKKPIDAAVAFETLTSTEVDAEGKSTSDSEKKNVIAEHKDLSDEAQTVNTTWNPEIATKAKLTQGETVKSGAKVTDTVKYKDLVPGKQYTLNADLVNKADKSVIGKGEKTFTPKQSAGKVDVEITVDSDVKNSVEAAVAFEELTSTEVNAEGEDTPDAEKPNHIAEHKDIDDEAQTVNSKKDDKPSETSTSETSTSSSKPSTSESKSSEPSTESSSESKTSEPSDSETSTSKTTTSTEPSSTTSSEKPEEPADTSAKPEISTNADFAQGSHEVVAGAEVVDEVSFEGLVLGKEYTLQAELISKADGQTVLGKGEKTFKPEKSAGKVDVKITVDSDVTEPVEAAVAFEELTSTEVDAKGEETPDAEKPNHIAEHKDIEDKDQTVTSKESTPGDSGKDLKPEISTQAELAGEADKVEAGAKVTDTVKFEDLVPGKEYTLNAELVNKADESVIGKGEKTFTPEKSAGKVDVKITVDSDVTEPVEAAVAFEELTSTEVDAKGEDTPDAEKPNKVAEHKDINDEDQTVTSDDSDVPGKPSKGKIPKWAILIPGIGLGIGLGKIIFGHHDHDKPKDRPEKDTEGHGEHPSTEVKGQDTPDKVDQNSSEEPRPTEVKGQDTPDKVDQGTDKDDRPVEVMGQEPGKTGKPLPSDAGRTEIKSVPSGATELDPGMQDYIK